MIPKRRKPEPMGLRHTERIRCPGHLKWVRGHECVVRDNWNHFCRGRIQAAHVRKGTDGALSIKPSDCWAIPLCEGAHNQQHQIGEPEFERRFQIDMKAVAANLWRKSPHRPKHERKQQAGGINQCP